MKNFIDQADDDGNLPWHWAVWKGNIEVLELLAPVISNFTLSCFGGRTALDVATEKNFIEIVRFLIEKLNVNPNAPDANGAEAWCWAIAKSHFDLIRYF
ncbi:MAG: ankyrin repeat domain-containing protein [Parachlamydiaceae bacterium]|nr:MAG: ankyrin repeat domain-containing protein [Parachlamydiaceae bacterium]